MSKNLTPTLQTSQQIFQVMIDILYENHTKHMNIAVVCEQSAKFIECKTWWELY
jgi:hypothetical protein